MRGTVRSALVLFVGLFLLTGCGIQGIPKQNNEVEAGWAEVINQYKRRADLVPNLVKIVKGYAKHERQTLENVTKARAKVGQVNISADKLNPQTMQKFQQAQSALSSALSRLMVVVERYPDLKASQNFRDLQIQLEGTENRIGIARRRYIEAVKQFNNYVTVPPYSWTNSLFYHFEKKPQFTVEDEKQIEQAPSVEL